MANQIVVSAGAKVRNLDGVLTATSGVVSSVPLGAANGVATLDSGGKVPVSQLPSSVVTYLGTWNAATNTPTLTNGVGDAGDMYICNVAGTVNFGAGPVTFAVGDWVLYGSGTWQKSNGQNGTVTSVGLSTNGGAITIGNSPITTSGVISANFNGTNLQYVNGAGNLTTFPTLITSIGLSMPSAFSVANSPLTANGTIAVTGAGYASQYIRGDGTLADFPSSGGGGSSVSYYLNGGTSQGTIGGTTYYEMSKTADTGTGVDFAKSGDGFIVAFLTDANDPAQLNIPAGNWNYEIYASMSANGGTPQMYAELYKYDGTTFTLISISSNEILYDGVNLNLYTFGMTVPATTLALTDRLAIKLYATNSGGKTTTVHTQDSHLCQVITTFSTGITALNGLTAQVQYFQVGTSGTDFNISSTTATHTFNLPTASATNRGALSSADWSTFNGKENTLTFYSPLVKSGSSVTIPPATSIANGYLTSTDWSTFNSKQAALSGTGFVKISGTTISYDNSTYALDSDVVKLTGNQTIGGTKTFSLATKNNSGILLSDTSSTAAPSGYISLAGYNYLTNKGLLINLASQTYLFLFNTAAGNNYTFPNATGTIALTSDLTGGTVTSVAALTIGTSGTDLSSTVANSTTTPVITLNVPTASATNRGALSSADWTTFNNKQNALTNPVTGTGTSGQVAYFNGTTSITSESNLFWDATNDRLGIGTSIPSQLLHLETTLGSSSGVGTAIQITSGGAGGDQGWIGVNKGTGNGLEFSVENRDIIFNTGATTPFGGTERMRITSAGITQLKPATGDLALEVFYGATSTGAMIGDASNFIIGGQTSKGLVFCTNNLGQEKMRITTGGNVLIGTTTDNGYKLDVNGTGRFKAVGNAYSNGSIILTNSTGASNTYMTNSGGIFYLSNNGSTDHLLIASTGAATFSSSVTAGTDVTLNNGVLYISAGSGTAYSSRLSTAYNYPCVDTYLDSYGGPSWEGRLNFRTNSGNGAMSTKLTITNSGAATFSSSVEAKILAVNGFGDSASQYITLRPSFVPSTSGGIGFMAVDHSGSSADGLACYGHDGISLYTAQTERMRITSDGNLLLGTTDNGSGAKLVFYSTSAAQQLKAAGTAPAITFSNTITSPTIGGSLGACTSANQFLTGTAAGDMILINQFTGNKLYITNYSGGVYLTQGATSWTANSDIRLKNINSYIENAVEKLSTLQTINFSYKDDKTNKQNLGLIAQEVEKIFPELIDKNGDGMLGVRYTELVPVLIKAVQELKLEIETLKNK